MMRGNFNNTVSAVMTTTRTPSPQAQPGKPNVFIGMVKALAILLLVATPLLVIASFFTDQGNSPLEPPLEASAAEYGSTETTAEAGGTAEPVAEMGDEADLTPNNISSNAELMLKGDHASAEAFNYAAQALSRYPPNPSCADVVVYAASIIAMKEKGFSETEAGAYVVSAIHYRRESVDAEGMRKILDFVKIIYPRFSDYRTATDTVLGECA